MHSNIRTLYQFSFLNGFRPHWPISIIYFREISGSYAAAMTVYSLVFLSQALFEVPAGMFSDGSERRRTMIFGAACASLSILSYAIGLSFWMLALGALLEGLSRALFSGTDSALLFESLKADEKEADLPTCLGKMNSMSQMALCLSAALCAGLALFSLKLILWVAVVPQFLSLGAAFFLRNVAKVEGEQHSFLLQLKEAFCNFRQNSKLQLLSIAETIDFGLGESIFYFQGAFFDTLVPTWTLGIVRCLNHLNGFIGFWFSGRVIQRVGARRTLILGTSAATAIRLLSVLLASVLTPFLMAMTNFFYGPTTSARGALLQQEFSDRQRATMGSMISLSGSLFFACSSSFLGYLADISSPRTAILFALLANGSIVFLYRRIRSDVD